MTTLFLTLIVFVVAVAAMAVGVILTGRRLQGSCGGLATGSCVCKAKGIVPKQCPRKNDRHHASEKLTALRRRPDTKQSCIEIDDSGRPRFTAKVL